MWGEEKASEERREWRYHVEHEPNRGFHASEVDRKSSIYCSRFQHPTLFGTMEISTVLPLQHKSEPLHLLVSSFRHYKARLTSHSYLNPHPLKLSSEFP
jgi:hypothetical protein